MKRLQEHDPDSAPPSLLTSDPSPALKKQKIGPEVSHGTSNIMQGSLEQDGEEGAWTRVEKRKAKKMRKVEAKMDANLPRFMYSKGEIVKRREAVGIADIRDLVLHLVADAPPPGWVRVENPKSIQRVVALLIPGITPPILSLPPLPTSATANPNLPLQIPLPPPSTNGLLAYKRELPGVPFIASTFSHACPTYAPGDQSRMHSVLSEFFQCPVSGEEKKKRILERVALERKAEKTPSRYVLTTEQMIENDYPVPSYMADVFQKPEGWVEVPNLGTATGQEKGVRVLAVDCEMCQTEDEKQLARVCLVDYASGIVVYDKLVKPDKPVTDYLTRWSGITPEALAKADTSFDTVQSHLHHLLSTTKPTPILLGHSLESDLKALRISHPRCIDTAVIFHHPRGRPLKPGLAWLTKKWLGREIQNRGDGGHDPEEDARACVDLLKKKVDNGPGFGEFKVDFESIFERMSRSTCGGGGRGAVRSAVVDHGNPASWHGKATTTIACKNDEDVLKGLIDVVNTHTFSFGRFIGLADALGWITNKSVAEPTATLPPAIPGVESEPMSAAGTLIAPQVLEQLNIHLQTLYNTLPPRTALVIFTGHSDPRKMSELNARKNAFEQAIKSGKTPEELRTENGVEPLRWTAADGRALEEEVGKARRGLLFLGIKDVKG